MTDDGGPEVVGSQALVFWTSDFRIKENTWEVVEEEDGKHRSGDLCPNQSDSWAAV